MKLLIIFFLLPVFFCSNLLGEKVCLAELIDIALKNNPETNILIVGHTDDTGGDQLNMDLSVRRAESVKSFISGQNVSSYRLTTSGKGEGEPIADNTTVDGRSQNRRVEIVIVANDQMKKDAKQGQ